MTKVGIPIFFIFLDDSSFLKQKRHFQFLKMPFLKLEFILIQH